MTNADGHTRRKFRTKFWLTSADTYEELVFQPDPIPEEHGEKEISHDERQDLAEYRAGEKPLFFGHYWLKGEPKPIRDNIACLDYSAVKNGKLVAYRFDGESKLDAKKFVAVEVN